MTYPVNVTTYSDRVSEKGSQFEVAFKYVGGVNLEVTAKDVWNNTLSDYGVLMNSTLLFTHKDDINGTTENETAVWDTNSLYTRVGHSRY